ncbi:hypothetical protein [Terracoccus sp. 273MFTsu3.1]|uniref:hypothetical protein n=1 Tax=Terracoccus sp. 273MFTsu3.1 TaxID=1172188 RepID=UPI0003721961|nr:hypothetical protein [Terracoccus sp. 273MFTsu3.1]
MSTTPEGFLYEVRCAGCARQVGVSRVSKYGVFCDEFDAWDFGVSNTEQRDAVVEAIIRDTDKSQAEVAREFGFTRQRMYQLRSNRDIRKTAAAK